MGWYASDPYENEYGCMQVEVGPRERSEFNPMQEQWEDAVCYVQGSSCDPVAVGAAIAALPDLLVLLRKLADRRSRSPLRYDAREIAARIDGERGDVRSDIEIFQTAEAMV